MYFYVTKENIEECFQILLLDENRPLDSVKITPEEINPKTARAILVALERRSSITQLQVNVENHFDFVFFQACGNTLSNSSIQHFRLKVALPALEYGDHLNKMPKFVEDFKCAIKKLAEGLSFEKNKPVTEITFHQSDKGASINEWAEALVFALSENKFFTSLDWAESWLGDKSATSIAYLLNNSAIEELKIDFNEIGDDGAIALANSLKNANTKLKDLSLGQNRIKTEGYKALAEAIAINGSLTSLSLKGDDIIPLTDEYLEILIPALKQNQTITHLDLSYSEISNRGARALADLLLNNKSIKILNIEACGNIDYEGLKNIMTALAKNSTLKELNIDSVSEDYDIGDIIPIQNLSLTTLHYDSSQIKNPEIIDKHLKRNQAIEKETDSWKKANLIWSSVYGQSGIPSLQKILIYTMVKDTPMYYQYLNCKIGDETITFINEARKITPSEAQRKRKATDELSDSEIKRPHNIAQTLSYKSDLDAITTIAPNEAKNSGPST